MIVLQELIKQFGPVRAVDGINLEIKEGEIFGFVGPDGAGKTTLIRMMTGILSPTAGNIFILSTPRLELIKGQMGYVPQRFSLYGDLTVMENIRIIGALYGSTGQQLETLATEILSFTNLLPFKDRLADNLSGGMKQKLALSAGLMHKPKVFFLDEPTTGVDPVSRREFWQMLYRLNKEGMTIVVSTPYMDEAELCHRIAFMHNGKIVSCGTPRELKANYPYHVLELSVHNRNIKQLIDLKSILDINAFGEKYHLIVEDCMTATEAIKEKLNKAAIGNYQLREIAPTLEDVFVLLAHEGV